MKSEKPRPPPVYTRTGDKGQTSLIGGRRVSKSDSRLDAYGTVDELNSLLGVVISTLAAELSVEQNKGAPPKTFSDEKKEQVVTVQKVLQTIQHELFNVGSRLACEEAGLLAQLPEVSLAQIEHLEKLMDAYTAFLSPLKNFILPGGSLAAAQTHVARTVCRRAERICVGLAHAGTEANESTQTADIAPIVEKILIQYLNRLSDYLFVLSRYLNHLNGVEEPLWKPHAP